MHLQFHGFTYTQNIRFRLWAGIYARITSWSRARIDVIPAALRDDSVLWGAYELAQGAQALKGANG